MNYETITTCDVANGEGFGVVLWVSGCDIHCPGCHNRETWEPTSGKEFTEKELNLILKELNKPHITRFTLSGGHPLMPCNRAEVKRIIQNVRLSIPDIEIWLYTGYIYEDLNEECRDICSYCDVIVDGPYIEELRDISLPFRGSKNQRIIRTHS